MDSLRKETQLKPRGLVLFFTIGISLKTWEKVGHLEREIKPYNLLAKYFDKIYFITYGKPREEKKFKSLLADNIEILPQKFSFLPSWFYAFIAPFLFKKELKKAEIYKTNQMKSVIPALLAKIFYKKKLLLRCGYEWLAFVEKRDVSLWKKKIIFLLEKIAYKKADKIILTSNEAREFVIKRFGVLPEKIIVLPNYIDTNLFKPLKIKKETNRIIFIGRLEKQKNLFNLVRAIGGLPFKLVLIGSGSLKENLKRFAREQKANLEFKNNIPNKDLPYELNKSEIFILPSFYEGCPKALLEAMSCGLPCIGTDVEGIREIMKHKENGYLCKIDASSIREAILRLSKDKALREKLANNARRTILENFSLEKILEKEKILQHKTFGRIHLYRINESSPKTKVLQKVIEVWEHSNR